MTAPKRLLVNGTCISRGPDSWPYFFEKHMAVDMVNLSVAGVGNTYVFETTMRELSRRSYDLVIVTWSTSHHVAVRVDDIARFADSQNTSLYQSSINDWPDKIIEPINDQDYVEKNWIMNVGHMSGIKDSVARFFTYYQNFVKFPQSLERDLTHIIAMQSYLQVKAIPYVFMYTRPIARYPRFDYLYRQIDWTKWYQDYTMKEIQQLEDGRYDSDRDPAVTTVWANPDGHALFARLLYDFVAANVIDPQNMTFL